MGLQVGIVGLPNAGKSTLFNALTRAGAAVAPYPFTTIEPNVGVVPLADERLQWLAELLRPPRVVPVAVEFVDIAGLVRGSHRGEGLGNQFLHHIRQVDAVLVLLRAFRAADVPHPEGTVDPMRDLAVLDTELILADLATVERRLERTRALARTKPREYGEELHFLEQLQAHLNSGQPARTLPRTAQEQAILSGLFLLTEKPRLYVLNLGEEQVPEAQSLLQPLLARAQAEGGAAMWICARLEEELAQLGGPEAQELRQAWGLPPDAVQQLAHAAYDLLGLISFFTVVGGNEIRAWEIRRGTTALKAAGKVHSDMERGFIRAEVVSFADLRRSGSLAAARELGLVRSEGRDYIVQDGDVIQFRFSV